MSPFNQHDYIQIGDAEPIELLDTNTVIGVLVLLATTVVVSVVIDQPGILLVVLVDLAILAMAKCCCRMDLPMRHQDNVLFIVMTFVLICTASAVVDQPLMYIWVLVSAALLIMINLCVANNRGLARVGVIRVPTTHMII